MEAPSTPRELYAGPEAGPEPPYPIKLRGPVIKGFGRGSKELGIPTANIPATDLPAALTLHSGVYFGYVGLSLGPSTSAQIYPAVLSIGYNPFYKNSVRSVEIHILHAFGHDFYGAALNLLILGFIRPEYDYDGLEALVKDIRTDCEVAKRSLERDGYARWKDQGGEKGWLMDFGWMDGVDKDGVEREVLNQDST